MLHQITWVQFIGIYVLCYIILLLVVFGRKLPVLFKEKPGAVPDKQPRRIWTPSVSKEPVDAVEAPSSKKIPMAPLAVAMTENEMYDSTSLLMDELDDLFNACFQEEWDQHHLLQQLHRKLQSYLALQSTKMYGSVNAYIQHQSYAICAVELTAQEVANLW